MTSRSRVLSGTRAKAARAGRALAPRRGDVLERAPIGRIGPHETVRMRVKLRRGAQFRRDHREPVSVARDEVRSLGRSREGEHQGDAG